MYHLVHGRSFDDFEPYISNNKQTGRTRGLPESNLLKSFAVDKEKTSSVAKIKVAVCSFYSLTCPFILIFLIQVLNSIVYLNEMQCLKNEMLLFDYISLLK
jgi:hypothetical protein